MFLEFNVNGMNMKLDVDPKHRLLDVLRDQLGLMGVKEGCGEGECGACTVIMDGVAVNSCMVLVHQARGKKIITVEALEQDGELDRLQKAFMENGAIQCGYCTPGMIMSCEALLMHNPNPTEEEVRIAIEGNLCRCTGYTKIVNAVKDVTEQNK